MAIKFGGEFEVKWKPEEVYDFLTDPKKFAPLFPDFQGMSEQDPTHFTVKVKVGISYIKGVAEVKMELTEADRPNRAQYKGSGSVAGGNVSLTSASTLPRPKPCLESYARSQAVKSNRRPNLSSKSAQSLAPKSAIIRWRFPQRCTRVSRSLLLWPNPRALQRTQPNSFRWNTNRWNPCWMRNRRWKTRAFFTRKWARIKSGTAFSNTEMWRKLFRKPPTWSTLIVCISIASPARRLRIMW